MRPSPREILVTSQDMLRLTSLIESCAGGRVQPLADALDEELEWARPVAPAEIAADVVTMNSRVRYVDDLTGREREVVLSYPQDMRLGDGRVSILSPVGVALLGLSRGQSIRWTMPDGASHALRVLDVVYQPEAAGDFHL